MSTENAEVISQTPATETNVEELKTEAKKVLEQASVNNKRSLEVRFYLKMDPFVLFILNISLIFALFLHSN
jgi:hypothetical protein